jgi:hypothetical protein
MTDISMENMRPLPDSFTTIDKQGRESFTPILGQEPLKQETIDVPYNPLVEMENFADYELMPDFISEATELPEIFRPKFHAVLDAMMRQHNWIGSMLDQPVNYNELPPDAVNYDPLKDKNVPLEYFRDVMYSRSPYESQLFIGKKETKIGVL